MCFCQERTCYAELPREAMMNAHWLQRLRQACYLLTMQLVLHKDHTMLTVGRQCWYRYTQTHSMIQV